MAAMHALTSQPQALYAQALYAQGLHAQGLHAQASPARGGALDLTTAPGAKSAIDPKTKAHTAAVNFEAQFLHSMFSQMFTGIEGDGPFGGGSAVGVWRSFLSEQYAKSFAKAGGIGIANHVYQTLIAQQEAHAR